MPRSKMNAQCRRAAVSPPASPRDAVLYSSITKKILQMFDISDDDTTSFFALPIGLYLELQQSFAEIKKNNSEHSVLMLFHALRVALLWFISTCWTWAALMTIIRTGWVQDSQVCLQTSYKSLVIADVFLPTGFRSFLFVFAANVINWLASDHKKTLLHSDRLSVFLWVLTRPSLPYCYTVAQMNS